MGGSNLRRLGIFAVCTVAAIVVAASALGASSGRHIQLGVLGNPSSFDPLTGQHTSVRLTIIGWDQGGGRPEYFGSLFATMGDEPMLGIGIPSGSGITPMAIANGQEDTWLLALNQAIVAWGKPIYVRPLAEMNGAWNSYCAYNRNGTSRGPHYSTSEFRKAFARIYLILHGKPNANAKLLKMGMPTVRGAANPAPNVKLVWNPQGFGNPNLPGNSAQAYYPGNAYVDVVGDDLYDQHFKAEWPAAAALYKAHPSKPFAFPEWGLWGIDDPAFVRAMATFVREHRRTIMISYYSGKSGSVFDLARKPRSRAAYRRLIAPLGG